MREDLNRRYPVKTGLLCKAHIKKFVKSKKVKSPQEYSDIVDDFFSEVKCAVLKGKEVKMPGKNNGSIYLAIEDLNPSGIAMITKIMKNDFTTKDLLKGKITVKHEGFDFKNRLAFRYWSSKKKNIDINAIVKISKYIRKDLNKVNSTIINEIPDLR